MQIPKFRSKNTAKHITNWSTNHGSVYHGRNWKHLSDRNFMAPSSHPKIPGKAISPQTFYKIWNDAAYLLAIGVRRNAIVTVDNHLVSKKRTGEKYNIFGKESCPKCYGDIRRLEINKRRAFVCNTCQPLLNQIS